MRKLTLALSRRPGSLRLTVSWAPLPDVPQYTQIQIKLSHPSSSDPAVDTVTTTRTRRYADSNSRSGL